MCNSFIFNVGVLTVSQAKYLAQIYHRTIHAQRSNFTYFKISRSLCEKFDTDADIQDSIFLASEVFTTKTKSACLTSQLITYLGVVKLEENFYELSSSQKISSSISLGPLCLRKPKVFSYYLSLSKLNSPPVRIREKSTQMSC